MTSEDLIGELELSTTGLIAALFAGDSEFLEYFEKRRRVVEAINQLPPDEVPASLRPRLQAAWRGGEIAEQRVQRIHDEIEQSLCRNASTRKQR